MTFGFEGLAIAGFAASVTERPHITASKTIQLVNHFKEEARAALNRVFKPRVLNGLLVFTIGKSSRLLKAKMCSQRKMIGRRAPFPAGSYDARIRVRDNEAS